MAREYNSKIEQHNNIAMNNTGKLIFKKCSDGENSVGISRNSQNNNIILGGDVAESNVNNIIQDCSGSTVGVMNNNTNNGVVPFFYFLYKNRCCGSYIL